MEGESGGIEKGREVKNEETGGKGRQERERMKGEVKKRKGKEGKYR